MVKQTWIYWKALEQNRAIADTLPESLPKNWKKNFLICNDIIKACPFCQPIPGNRCKIGNLEHLDLYCSSPLLRDARLFCNQKIEDAIYNLCEFSAFREYSCSLVNAERNTTLHENLIMAARDSELQERPVVILSHIEYQKRENNQAIKSRRDVQLLVLLQKLDPSILEDFEKFPLASQLGFIHAIPEEDFDITTAAITDVAFLGFLPKMIFQTLCRYEIEIQRCSAEKSTEFRLFEDLITSFVYRPILMQKIIHILLAQHRECLSAAGCDQEDNNDSTSILNDPTSQNIQGDTNVDTPETTMPLRRKCFASKCRLLWAKGVLQQYMVCTNGQSMCVGCYNELAKQRKVHILEQQVLTLSVDNENLSP